MRRAVLGIDLGTGSVKAAIVDADSGEILALGSSEHPTNYPEPNAAEQSPVEWWRATIEAVSQAKSHTKAEYSIERIGITGQMHGTVLLDSGRNPIGNAIIWSDSRSASSAQAMMDEASEQIIKIAGSPIAAGFQAATLRWLQSWQNFETVLTPKDYLRFRLTGELATDPSDAAGTLLSDRQTRDWSPKLLSLATVSRANLPEIRPSASVAGELTAPAAQALGLLAGTPVVTGAADAAAAALGAGVTSDHQLLITLSTGAQVLVPRSSPEFDAKGRLHTFASALEPSESAAGWYIMGATMVAGLALRWLRDTLFADFGADAYDRMTAFAMNIPLGAERLLFLPHMTGERSPNLNPLARGAFIGLNPSHTREHLTRAVLEGVVFSIYDAYLAVKNIVTDLPSEIILAGGGARSPVWRTMIADLFNLPVRPLETAEQTVIGAAILAAAEHNSPASIANRWAKYGDPFLPNPDRHLAYAKLFSIYAEANHSLTATFAALSTFQAIH